MKIISQPINSTMCGQCCVAMVSGKSLDSIITMFGHRYETTSLEMIMVFKKLKIQLGTEKLIRAKKFNDLPKMALINIRYKDKKMGHWSIYRKGKIYCPTLGKYEVNNLEIYPGAKITSFIKLVRPGR